MRKVIEWVVTHPTVVNLFMVGVVVAGFFAIDVMPKESFPETSFDVIVGEAQARACRIKDHKVSVKTLGNAPLYVSETN